MVAIVAVMLQAYMSLGRCELDGCCQKHKRYTESVLLQVSVGGVPCAVVSAAAQQLMCMTGQAHGKLKAEYFLRQWGSVYAPDLAGMH